MWFRKQPIPVKLRLIITAACVLAVALTYLGFLIQGWFSFRSAAVRDLTLRGRLTAANTAAAVVFGDVDNAAEFLEALKTDPATEAAVIFDRKGERVASFPTDLPLGALPFHPVSGAEYVFSSGRLTIHVPIFLEHRTVGMLSIRQSLQELSRQLRFQVLVAIGVMAASTLAAYGLANFFQRIVSEPILALAETARLVAEGKNFEVRAIRVSDDEIGFLTEAFNTMLARIQERETAVMESESRIRAVIDSALDSVMTVNDRGEITAFNVSAERTFRWSRDSVLNRPIESLLVPASMRPGHPLCITWQNTDSTSDSRLVVHRVETLAVRADGAAFPVELTVTRINHHGPSIFAVFIRDITERKRADRELRRASERLALINRLDRIISSHLDLGAVYEAFVKEMRNLISFDRTSIVMINAERGTWEILRRWTPQGTSFSVGESFPLEGSGVGWVVLNRRALVEDELGSNGHSWLEHEHLRNEGVRSRALLPLLQNDHIIGVLTVGSTTPCAFDEEALAFLHGLTDQLAVAAQNARLYEQVQKHAGELEQRVAERTTELEAANKELEAFSYSVSHDLRAPLRSMAGFSRIMADDFGPSLPPDARRHLGRIQKSAEQMGRLIDDLLAFSRLNRHALSIRPLDMGRLVQEVWSELEPEMNGRVVELVVGDLPVCFADPSLLKQVVVNLLSNAIKYSRTQNPSRVEFGAEADALGTLNYFVKDNGVGFDMRYVHKLFGVFQRLHRADEFEGTGVGLATVQRVINRHGGRIWAEATLGAGAIFRFTLPPQKTS